MHSVSKCVPDSSVHDLIYSNGHNKSEFKVFKRVTQGHRHPHSTHTTVIYIRYHYLESSVHHCFVTPCEEFPEDHVGAEHEECPAHLFSFCGEVANPLDHALTVELIISYHIIMGYNTLENT